MSLDGFLVDNSSYHHFFLLPLSGGNMYTACIQHAFLSVIFPFYYIEHKTPAKTSFQCRSCCFVYMSPSALLMCFCQRTPFCVPQHY